ncbi:MAG: hypothetical protein A2W25_01395 [candidate division Zixibacteria bacterium RBG_16_53_22]|nr:MAG: hypothetical protein A2W25_01395 [candidate division Zixibacteria bacterium RBG_16_53_22]
MAHTLILGQTESGKTTFARILAEKYRARGIPVLVLDAAHNAWPADYQTADAGEFMQTTIRSRGAAVFIDEAGRAVSWLNKDMADVASMYRHLGHFAHFIAQRPTMVAPTVRHNCSRMVLFSVSRADAADLGKEWTCDEIAAAPQFKQGEHLIISRFGAPVRGNLF